MKTINNVIEIITKNKAIELVNSSKGKFFTVTFIKKDKSQRRMTARTGVKIVLMVKV